MFTVRTIDEDGVSLADVEEGDFEFAVCGVKTVGSEKKNSKQRRENTPLVSPQACVTPPR